MIDDDEGAEASRRGPRPPPAGRPLSRGQVAELQTRIARELIGRSFTPGHVGQVLNADSATVARRLDPQRV